MSLSSDFSDAPDFALLATVRNAPNASDSGPNRWADRDPRGPLSDEEAFALVFDANFASRASLRRGAISAATAERDSAVELVVRRCVPNPEHAEALLDMWRAGTVTIAARTVAADKNGIFEDNDGACVREYDSKTSRQVISLSVDINGWADADGNAYRADSMQGGD